MKTDPDIIFNNVHVPTPIFNDYLHENCYQFFGEIAECASAASYLSDSDVLFAELDSEYSVERAQLGRYAWYVIITVWTCLYVDSLFLQGGVGTRFALLQ